MTLNESNKITVAFGLTGFDGSMGGNGYGLCPLILFRSWFMTATWFNICMHRWTPPYFFLVRCLTISISTGPLIISSCLDCNLICYHPLSWYFVTFCIWNTLLYLDCYKRQSNILDLVLDFISEDFIYPFAHDDYPILEHKEFYKR